MRLYAEYMKEREDIEVIYDDHCFISYSNDDGVVTVYNMFCDSTVRGTGYMLNFYNNFINNLKKDDIKRVYATTDIRTNGWKRSESLLLEYGFKFLKVCTDDINYKFYIYEL